MRFAEHDFVRCHAGFPLRNFRKIDFDSSATARSHFRGRAGKSGGAHVLNCNDSASLHGLEASFEEQFFNERVADLHVGAFLLRLFSELGGSEQRRAVNTIAPGFCANINYRITQAFGFGEKDFFFFRDTEGQRVDQLNLRKARLETNFASNGGNAKTISIVGDAAWMTPSRMRRLAAIVPALPEFDLEPGVAKPSAVMGPKRSESRIAIGRAPMVKISRRIPPTPVVAP